MCGGCLVDHWQRWRTWYARTRPQRTSFMALGAALAFPSTTSRVSRVQRFHRLVPWCSSFSLPSMPAFGLSANLFNARTSFWTSPSKADAASGSSLPVGRRLYRSEVKAATNVTQGQQNGCKFLLSVARQAPYVQTMLWIFRLTLSLPSCAAGPAAPAILV